MNPSDRKFDNFDEFAGNYRQIHTENLKLSGADSDYFSEYRIIEIESVEQKYIHTKTAPLKILDLGCGDGNAARFFKKYFFKASVYGIDISEKIVSEAKKRNLEDCYFQVYDGENIPFEENTFDIIFLVGTLHHIDASYHLKLMQESYKVLKPTGRMYNFEHNPWNPLTKKIVRDCPFDANAVLVSAPYVKTLEKRAGFKQLKVRFTLFFPRFKIFTPFLFLEKYLSWLPLGGQYYIFGSKSST